MSFLRLNKGAAPSTPAASKGAAYEDTADKRLKFINEDGEIQVAVNSCRMNRLGNSGFWFARRQAAGTLTTYSATAGRAFTADRWAVTNENASVQYQRLDTSGATEVGLQNRFYGRWKKITSAGKMAVTQVIEGTNSAQLRQRTVRFQALMRCSVAASMNVRLGLIQLTNAGTIDTIPATFISAYGAVGTDPTLGTNLAYIAPKSGVTPQGGTVNGNAVDCALTTSWQKFGTCFDVPDNIKNLIVAVWTNGQPAANDELNISEISLTEGYETQDWSPLHLSEELGRCLRFYQKTFAIDVAPAQNVGLNSGEIRGIAGKAAAVANAGQVHWRFPAVMRATPVQTLYNPAAANAQLRDITGSVDFSATAATAVDAQSLSAVGTGNAATAVGNIIGLHAVVDIEL